MNFLAHAYLSGTDNQLLAGNFFADFVKGRQALRAIHPAIARGIALHRHIDAYTDAHALVAISKNRLKPKYRHYAGVIVDVFYDHFLASLWPQYHPQPLEQYVQDVYHTIDRQLIYAPSDFAHMFHYMRQGNWLFHYAKTEGIARALAGMAQRTPYLSKMDEAVEDLLKNYDDFKYEFQKFFPALTSSCKQWIAEHPGI